MKITRFRRPGAVRRCSINVVTVLAFGAMLGGCASERRAPDLAALYNEAASNIGDARNPVLVIPGIHPAAATPTTGSAGQYGESVPGGTGDGRRGQ